MADELFQVQVMKHYLNLKSEGSNGHSTTCSFIQDYMEHTVLLILMNSLEIFRHCARPLPPHLIDVKSFMYKVTMATGLFTSPQPHLLQKEP